MELTVRLRTLTPLYTGGVDGTMDRIHETGILGSLHWWYEAIVRGLEGSACDPVSDGRCPDNEGNYCDVCAVFGATGLQRAFRMEGPVWWNEAPQAKLTVKMRRNRQHRGWHLGRGLMGQAALQFIPLRLPDSWTQEDLWQSLLLTWTIMAKWGGLGPKTQQGYGVVQAGFEGTVLDVEQALQAFDRLRNRINRRQVKHNDHWPSLDRFFFAKVNFNLGEQEPQEWLRQRTTWIGPNEEIDWYLEQPNNENSVLPLASVVRYHLRQFIRQARDGNNRWVFSHDTRHHLMGEQGRKSLIHVSHAYPIENNGWEFRIWGWIPEQLPGGIDRPTVFQYLRQWLGVSQEKKWHGAQTNNEILWQPLQIQNVQVCWFSKRSENRASYLKALLNGCENASNRGGSGSDG